MSAVVASCPSCSYPVEFRWAGAVQATCPHCRSVLVRTDVDLRAVGRRSLVPPTVSPIQLGTQGSFDGRRFTVVGRIVYEYERGRWNEWHLVFSDGQSGWLSDAQAEYAVSFHDPGQGSPPPATALKPGQRLFLGGVGYEVSTLTRARYVGTEGELPFESWQRDEVPFADLQADDGRFATIDYSDRPPLLFTGRYVEFDALGLSGLRDAGEGQRAQAQTFACPNCGGTVQVRLAGMSVNVVCQYCSSVLDAGSTAHTVLQTFQSRLKHTPKIPLGSRGRLHGAEWDVIGFQVRTIRVEGVDYAWDEYLLFSPRRGFRYLTEYRGHWNDAVPVRTVPNLSAGTHPAAHFRGKRFKHFQTATAETTFVLGEFPWEVRVGDTARVQDYVAPPLMLSLEETGDERQWTLAEYVPGARIWEAFGVAGKAPLTQGVFANQPSPHGHGTRQVWKAFAVLALLFLAAMAFRFASASGRPVASGAFEYDPGAPEERNSAVLGPFTLEGRTSNVQVRIDTDMVNNWAYFDAALVNQETGRAIVFAREASYYSGTEGGERWSEGSGSARARIPSVPPGRYTLHLEPEGSAGVRYQVSVRRDVPAGGYWAVAFLLLMLPPLASLMGAGMFESRRWAESDYSSSEE
jgi:ribosomal protein L37AE/L43A